MSDVPANAAPSSDAAAELQTAMQEIQQLTELETRLTDNAVAPLDATTELVEQNAERELERVPEPQSESELAAARDSLPATVDSDNKADNQVKVELPSEPENWAPRDAAQIEKRLSEEASVGEDEDAEGEVDELASDDDNEDEQMPFVHESADNGSSFAAEKTSAANAYDEPEEDIKPKAEANLDNSAPATEAHANDETDETPSQGPSDEPTRRSASPVRRPRRPPGQQRRSPSYNMDVPPPPAEVPAPRPAAARSSFSRPSAGRAFDFEDLTFPEGLSMSSPSVRKHRSLVEAWKEALTAIDLGRESQALHLLFRAAAEDGDVDDARGWFDHFFKLNPTATIPLSQMIDLELSHGNFVQVVGLYERALRGAGGVTGVVPGVEIWKSYLHYIRRQNPIPPPGATNGASADTVRDTIRKAYELALDRCGQDIDSGEIWREYIAFLGEKETSSTWETSQQTDAIRKAYHQAVVIPLNDVEVIWREYDAFENKLNKATAKRFLAERSPLYMTARTVMRELKSHLEPLVMLDVPPRPTWIEGDRQLANSWKRYLKWEEGNPLDIEDVATLHARVGYAYRKCLTQMRYFPEIWHQASHYFSTHDKADEGTAYLKTGLEANPSSFLLTFAYAELLEGKRDFAACRSTFDALIENHGKSVQKLRAAIEAEVAQAQGPEIELSGEEVKLDTDEDMDVSELSEAQRLAHDREARGKEVRDRRQKEVDDILSAAGVIWIMYIRFARRSEGLKSARAIFAASRKSPFTSWQVYESCAYMEYHCNKDSNVATKIFELGLKAFPDSVDFALKFLQFQLQINDDGNARALFERLVAKFPTSKARPVWDAWARHEYMYGDLAAVQKLETRFTEVYPNDAPLKRFAAKYNYLGNDQIAIRDLGFGLKPPAAAAAPKPAAPAKRPLPEEGSPSQTMRRLGRDRERDRQRPEPLPKRPRPASPPPPRPAQNRWNAPPREPSPPPRARATVPRPEPAHPSGLSPALVWFLGNLPSARAFDGPLFRAEDLMNVLSTVAIGGGGGAAGGGRHVSRGSGDFGRGARRY